MPLLHTLGLSCHDKKAHQLWYENIHTNHHYPDWLGSSFQVFGSMCVTTINEN